MAQTASITGASSGIGFELAKVFAANMDDIGLAKQKNMPTAKDVAQFAYKKMLKGKTIAIYGLLNRLMAFSIRFSPRFMVNKVTHRLIKK